jgi:hypothetical protein
VRRNFNKLIPVEVVNAEPIWITGSSRSGKTSRLVNQFCAWVAPWLAEGGDGAAEKPLALSSESSPSVLPGVLALAAIGDNRLDLADRLSAATHGHYPCHSTTPLGFFQDEVMLFWSLLIQQLDLNAQFPLRLAPENEQELATHLWKPEFDQVIARVSGQASSLTEARLVRRVLDILQLAALAGISIEDIPVILSQGLAGQSHELPLDYSMVGTLLHNWQTWCLERGLLTYGILAGLYWQYLLPHPIYQQHLRQRYALVLADDVDEYPAIARSLFEVFLDAGTPVLFTYNPDGAVRLGLGADPEYLAGLAHRCRIERLTDRPYPSLVESLGDAVVELVIAPTLGFPSLPDSMRVLQTTSRAQLLQQTTEEIVDAIQTKQIQPQEIAVIAPGLDAIARYSLINALNKQGIPVASLHDQRPLTSFPIVRALLTLLTLVYPGLGRLCDRDAAAEMLIILSQKQTGKTQDQTNLVTLIDPVRAGLLADYCFVPHPDHPRLLPAATFPRWDRLGYQASSAYQDIVQWIDTQQAQLQQRLIPNPISFLDRAIQQFLLGGGSLPFDQLSALRQLLETAQHYWDVHSRLRGRDRSETPMHLLLSRFIQLLRSGIVTANPFPVRPIGPSGNAITLATVFQYRSSRSTHRWQFWLDAGSPRWLSGVDALFGAPLFLRDWSGRPWTTTDTMTANERRLRRILLDLLARAEERVYLCHSDLATSGQDQTGLLVSLVNAAMPLHI